jgi:acetyl esterase/lipase
MSSLENHVDERSIPLFVMHTSDDSVVPVENTLCLGAAYAAAGIPFEMHIYPKGPHGMALANDVTARGIPECANEAMANWVQLILMRWNRFSST